MLSGKTCKRVFAALSLAGVIGLLTFPHVSDAAKLSDLIKQTPKLYLPSQILPGREATFTVQGKPGREVKLILSSQAEGAELPNGTALGVGKANIEEKGIIPASGVLELKVTIPADSPYLGDKQFVEAFVWSNPDQSDAQLVEMIESSGQPTNKNVVFVGSEPNGGSTMIIPGGDPGISNLLRGVSSLGDVGDDPRKKELLDDGNINRKRLIDQNLNSMPSR